MNSTDLAGNSVTAAKLGAAAKFRKVTQTFGTVGPMQVISLGGLRVIYTCQFDGVEDEPRLNARTTVDNAAITLELTSAGSSYNNDIAFNKADSFSLTEGATRGEGTATYSAPNGSVVTLNFGFDSSTTCLAHAVALAR